MAGAGLPTRRRRVASIPVLLLLAVAPACRERDAVPAPPGESATPSAASPPTPAPEPPRQTALPAGWPLPLPPGAQVTAVNWGEPTPGVDKVQLSSNRSADEFLAFYERELTTAEKPPERQNAGASRFLEATRADGRFGVEVWSDERGVGAIVTWHH